MAFQTVAQAVRAGLTGAGVTGALDFLAFDTCLLGSPEVASAFADVTKVFLADAEIDYGAGWDYTKTFTWLAAHPTTSAVDFARQEVAFWKTHHASSEIDVLYGSHVAIDMSALPAFETAVAALVTGAQANAGALPMARAFDMALPDYQVANLGNDAAPVPLKDVGQILTTLSKDPTVVVAKAAAAANTALGPLVIARASGAARMGQSGLNVGAGIPIDFTPALSARYRQLVTSWNATTKWADLIDYVRGAADDVGPVISSTGLVGRKIPFQVNDADLLSFEFTIWNMVSNRAYMLQFVQRNYAAPGAYDFTWSGNVLAIDATPDPVLVSVLPWREVAAGGASSPIFKVPGTVEIGGDTLYTELIINSATMSSEVALVYLGELPSAFPVSTLTEPGTTFRPMFFYVDQADGEVHVEDGPTKVTFAGDSVAFTTAGLSAGDYSISLQAKDTWGNETARFFPFTLP
jgi:hypothetical protein